MLCQVEDYNPVEETDEEPLDRKEGVMDAQQEAAGLKWTDPPKRGKSYSAVWTSPDKGIYVLHGTPNRSAGTVTVRARPSDSTKDVAKATAETRDQAAALVLDALYVRELDALDAAYPPTPEEGEAPSGQGGEAGCQ